VTAETIERHLQALLSTSQGDELNVILLAQALGRAPTRKELEETCPAYGIVVAAEQGTVTNERYLNWGNLTIDLTPAATAIAASRGSNAPQPR
jgi:predicted component of type VI protein secretion system